MNMTILRAVRELEMDVDRVVTTKVDLVERDNEQFVTLYGTERDGQLYYIVLDQKVIDKLKTI